MTDVTDGNGATSAKPALKGLSQEDIFALVAKTRVRGAYEAPLVTFVESDEVAISIKDNYPIFAQKEASTLYQGFLNAAKKADLTDTVDVKRIGEDVFLFHKARLATMQAELNSVE